MLIGWRSDTVTYMGGKRGKRKREGVMLDDERGPETAPNVDSRVRVNNSHHNKSYKKKKEMTTKLLGTINYFVSPAPNNKLSPFCYVPVVRRTYEGQAAKSSLGIETAFRHGAVMGPCCTFINV